MSARTRRILLAVAVLLVAAAIFHFRHKISFDWTSLRQQLRAVSWKLIALGVGTIYLCYWMRAWRWAVLIRPLRQVPINSLVPSQVIGFTAVALIGRVADFARPYLVARRFELPVAGQIAVYSVERAFDLASAAIVFSLTLAFAPASLPHHEKYVHAGEFSLFFTAALVIFAITLRIAGGAVASMLRALVRPFSGDLADAVGERVLEFREGLGTLATQRQFWESTAISLVMWYAIACCYLLCARAFTAEPTLAGMSFTAVMLIFATSLGGSLIQLPIIGWFTQITINALALHTLLHVPSEAATACATVMLIVMNLVILPAGLIAARFQGTSLRAAARASERVSEG